MLNGVMFEPGTRVLRRAMYLRMVGMLERFFVLWAILKLCHRIVLEQRN